MIPTCIIEIVYFLCPSIRDNNDKLNPLFVIKIICLFDKYIIISTTHEVQYMVDVLQSGNEYEIYRSVAVLLNCYCFIIVEAVIVLGLGALFLLFVLLSSQRVSSHSCETLRELPPDSKYRCNF